jgi:hypothetical protein
MEEGVRNDVAAFEILEVMRVTRGIHEKYFMPVLRD